MNLSHQDEERSLFSLDSKEVTPQAEPSESQKRHSVFEGQDETPIENKKKKNSMSAFEWMESAIFALIAISLIFAFGFRTVGVDGGSMDTTLLHGDTLILSSYTYTTERGDIIVINRKHDEPLIKRVIALAGDRLDIDPETGEVILNGEVLQEPYLDRTFTARNDFTGELIIPEGYLFVMGDNRGWSLDSRSDEIGFIDEDEVMGKALFRIAPIDRFGGIYED